MRGHYLLIKQYIQENIMKPQIIGTDEHKVIVYDFKELLHKDTFYKLSPGNGKSIGPNFNLNDFNAKPVKCN